MSKAVKASRVSRRDFMKVAGIGAAAPVLGGTILISDANAQTWDSETDVVSVGSGGAALSAAVAAIQNKATVVVLEKGPAPGGTTAKSGGAYWIPNSPFMQAAGLKDAKDDAIRYMARVAFLMDRDGHWSLSPTFDVVYAYNPTGRWTAQHQM